MSPRSRLSDDSTLTFLTSSTSRSSADSTLILLMSTAARVSVDSILIFLVFLVEKSSGAGLLPAVGKEMVTSLLSSSETGPSATVLEKLASPVSRAVRGHALGLYSGWLRRGSRSVDGSLNVGSLLCGDVAVFGTVSLSAPRSV